MPINILMPALSPTMEKGNLAKWLKKEGDKVKSGDVIAEIETDKATMEVEAVDEGTIAKIIVPEGTQDVPVNDVIAVLAGDGEDVKAAGAGAAAAKPAPKVADKAADKAAEKPTAAPPAKPAAAPAPVAKAAPVPQAAGPAPQANGRGRIFSSPLARRLAKEAGIELGRITGTGPHGRMRRTIAQRLTASVQNVPHFYLTIDCDIGKLLVAREEINKQAPTDKDKKPLYKLSVNDFVIKAMAVALQKIPNCNVSWTEG